MKLYSLYENLLNEIEASLNENPTADMLANKLYVSATHLRRLFKGAFGMPLASYIRSRKLAASLDMLLNSDAAIVDIASNFCFDHPQSYIRAFKSEFGITPGELRKTGQIVNVKPPLQMFSASSLSEGVLFGPEIVFVPEFHCVGIHHVLPDHFNNRMIADIALDFCMNEIAKIPNIKVPDVYYGITLITEEDIENLSNPNSLDMFPNYIPSVCVHDFSDVPPGFTPTIVPSSLCVKFHYIGQHHPTELDANIMSGMYDAIDAFNEDENAKYGIYNGGLYFERIALADYDGTFCKMEWFTPVHEK